MAIVLDIYLLSKKTLELNTIENTMNKYKIIVDTISSIDSWLWDNEHQISDLDNIVEVINQNKIIIIKLISPLFKDLGIYIEKIRNKYLYNLWINTEGYYELDCDSVNARNSAFYEKIYQAILNVESRVPNSLEVAGIGLESDFHYSENIGDIIQSSRNIVAWILNDNIKEEALGGYKKKIIKEANKILFEKTEA